jgi:hypothetical protein
MMNRNVLVIDMEAGKFNVKVTFCEGLVAVYSMVEGNPWQNGKEKMSQRKKGAELVFLFKKKV